MRYKYRRIKDLRKSHPSGHPIVNLRSEQVQMRSIWPNELPASPASSCKLSKIKDLRAIWRRLTRRPTLVRRRKISQNTAHNRLATVIRSAMDGRRTTITEYAEQARAADPCRLASSVCNTFPGKELRFNLANRATVQPRSDCAWFGNNESAFPQLAERTFADRIHPITYCQ